MGNHNFKYSILRIKYIIIEKIKILNLWHFLELPENEDIFEILNSINYRNKRRFLCCVSWESENFYIVSCKMAKEPVLI